MHSPTSVWAMAMATLVMATVSQAASPATSTPISFNFGVTIPTVPDATSGSAPYLTFAGYRFPLVKEGRSGNLVSFFGNFVDNTPTNTQLTAINPNAPANVTTASTTGSTSGGPSTSNATISADDARVVSTAFSSGNSSSAAAGANDGGTGTSTSSSSSGLANSTATANALGVTTILTNATVADASNAQSIQNANAAVGATSCAASASGASSEADDITLVEIPVGDPSQHLSIVSAAYAACAAGLDAPVKVSGSSASGSQASLTSVSSTVTCDGVTSTNQRTSTIFNISINGVYSKATGFSGAIAAQRVAQSLSHC